MDKRASGILLHITSLPGPFGMGDLGPAAYRFADFLGYAGQHIWQILPLVPVGYGYSPYAGLSTFAGDPHLISPERLRDAGLLTDADLAAPPAFPDDHVDFEPALTFKRSLLRTAFARHEAGHGHLDAARFQVFCAHNAAWLDDFALFMTLKDAHGGQPWTNWAAPLRRRDPEALAEAHALHATEVRMRKFWQFLFDEQWQALRTYCNARDIKIMGDLPIYVAHDSADVWANPGLFYLEDDGQPTVVSGVPPDYFSETGQRWGNPLYRWDVMQEGGYAWWTQRFAKILEWVDLVRLDHFRGFEAYWEIPASEPTAINGRWVKGPGADLFEVLHDRLGALPVIAENLGVITDGVTALMEQFDFPGMAILQFAFDGDAENGFLPHNFTPNLVAYTGTHDNDTVVGWWAEAHASTQDAETIARSRAYCKAYLGFTDAAEIHWAFSRSLMASAATLVVTPLQDVLGLGSQARMNIPGHESGNWGWRYRPEDLTMALADRLRTLTALFGRSTRQGAVHEVLTS